MKPTQIIADLIIVYGFSKAKAKLALDMFYNGELTKGEERCMVFLMQNPFIIENDNTGGTKQAYRSDKVFNFLNYRLNEFL